MKDKVKSYGPKLYSPSCWVLQWMVVIVWWYFNGWPAMSWQVTDVRLISHPELKESHTQTTADHSLHSSPTVYLGMAPRPDHHCLIYQRKNCVQLDTALLPSGPVRLFHSKNCKCTRSPAAPAFCSPPLVLRFLHPFIDQQPTSCGRITPEGITWACRPAQPGSSYP